MKFKITVTYLGGYLINLPLIMIHELSHYVVAVILYCISYTISFPKLEITRKFKVEENEDGGLNSYGWSARVTYLVYESQSDIAGAITAVAPAISSLFIFYFAPWWLYPVLILEFNSLWLSKQDIESVLKPFKRKELLVTTANENESKNKTE